MTLRRSIAGSTINYYYTIEDVEGALSQNLGQPSQLASLVDQTSKSWDLGMGFDEAARAAIYGWEPLVFKNAVLRLRRSTGSRLRWYSDVVGEDVDISRFLTGEPEHWRASRRSRKKQTVSFVVNISAAFGENGAEMLNRGVALASVVEQLRSQNELVKLIICNCVTGEHSSRKLATFVEVVSPGQIIMPGRLHFWLAHPAALRRVFFRLKECATNTDRREFGIYLGGYYGNPEELDHLEPNQVYIPSFSEADSGAYSTPEMAMETVFKTLAVSGHSITLLLN